MHGRLVLSNAAEQERIGDNAAKSPSANPLKLNGFDASVLLHRSSTAISQKKAVSSQEFLQNVLAFPVYYAVTLKNIDFTQQKNFFSSPLLII